jgi:hypothetical protein
MKTDRQQRPIKPTTAKRTQEILKLIVDALKPWRNDNPSDINKRVNEQVRLLQAVAQDFFSRSAVNKARDDAEKLLADIKRIERRIANVSPELRARLKLQTDAPSALRDELERLREECKCAASAESELIREQCARTAWLLVQLFSQKEPASSENNPHRNVTSLVYEAVTGQAEKDLRRACDKILDKVRTSPSEQEYPDTLTFSLPHFF